MNFTLRQLSYFKALAEHRHFGRAAEAVHISQPALSVQIRELEAQLGGALVERQSRDINLTPLGRSVFFHACRVLDATKALEQAARWDGGLSGELRLGIIPTIAPYLLPGTIAELRARDIRLDIQVREAKTDRLMESLRNGGIDAAVIALPSQVSGVIEAPLFEDRFLLAGTETRLKQLEASGTQLLPTQLGNSQLLLLEDGHCLTDQALEVCGRGRTHAQINTGASSLATLTRLVDAGFGLTLMPEIAAHAEACVAENLRLRRFDGQEPSRHIGLVRREATPGEGWFNSLVDVLRNVGEKLIRKSRETD